MADEVDITQQRAEHADIAIHSFRYDIPSGEEGICDDCGEYSPRLIAGRCAFCRDGRRRPDEE